MNKTIQNQMVNVTFRMDKHDKQNFEKIINELGLNLSSAFNIFAKAVLREGGIPFELRAEIPNEETRQAMINVLNDENMEEFSLEELIAIAKRARGDNV